MNTLHIINKSANEYGNLAACLRLIAPDSGILLTEDAIYAAQQDLCEQTGLALAMTDHPVYVLTPDLTARGISVDNIADGITLVDYDGFVTLTTEYDKTLSW